MGNYQISSSIYISSDPSIPDQTYINHRKAINNTQDPITITTEKNQTILVLNLIENNMSYGWFYIVLPIDKHIWLTQQKKILQTIVTLCVNSIQLMFSYDKINNKIKHLTNANEFISRLSLTSTNTISNIIVTQLKKTFEFDYVILPKHSHYDMDWGASTVDVPKKIRSLVDSLNIPSLFKPPYNPIRYTIDQPNPYDQLSDICNYYKSHECHLLPIIQDDILVGYYMGFYKEKNDFVDMNLLSITNKQISSILYRSIVNDKIVSTQQFYQDIIDHLSSIIIVLDSNFEIKFSNQYFREFLTKITQISMNSSKISNLLKSSIN